jgi:hypothetical protein
MARRQRRMLLGTATALFALIAVPVLLYAQGYRFSSGFTLTKTGGLYVSAGAAEARIYLNNRLRKETGLLQRGLFVQNLAPATYSVLVSKEEFWPWQKTLQVQEQYVAEAKAFLVPREPQGVVLVNGNYEAFFASPNGRTVLLIENANGRKKAVFYDPAANRFLNEADAATTRALAYQSELLLLDWQDSVVRLAHEKGLVQASMQDTVVQARVTGRAPAATSTRQEYWTYHDRERIWLDRAANAIWVEWLDSTSTLPYYLQAPRELVFQSIFFRNDATLSLWRSATAFLRWSWTTGATAGCCNLSIKETRRCLRASAMRWRCMCWTTARLCGLRLPYEYTHTSSETYCADFTARRAKLA